MKLHMAVVVESADGEQLADECSTLEATPDALREMFAHSAALMRFMIWRALDTAEAEAQEADANA